jgi:hypothetical protein
MKQQGLSGSTTSFAANGNGSNTIWIDPEHDIVFVWHAANIPISALVILVWRSRHGQYSPGVPAGAVSCYAFKRGFLLLEFSGSAGHRPRVRVATRPLANSWSFIDSRFLPIPWRTNAQ